mgnify:CR=1 FL=1
MLQPLALTIDNTNITKVGAKSNTGRKNSLTTTCTKQLNNKDANRNENYKTNNGLK